MKINRISSKLILVFSLLMSLSCVAQEMSFAKEIMAFKRQDSLKAAPQHAILFVGSSSFTKWTDIQNYFPDVTLINRGFGGSTLLDLIRYTKDVVIPYHPKQIFVYCGENDIASSDTVRPDLVLSRYRQFHEMVRKELPDVKIVFVSIKPSPSRWKFEKTILESNRLIKGYLKKQKLSEFLDIHQDMLTKEGTPMPDIYISDQLHMNANGYRIWQKKIDPLLMRN